MSALTGADFWNYQWVPAGSDWAVAGRAIRLGSLGTDV